MTPILLSSMNGGNWFPLLLPLVGFVVAYYAAAFAITATKRWRLKRKEKLDGENALPEIFE